MRFTVHDVGHGQCISVLADNGRSMLFDCGYRAFPEHRPSRFLPSFGIAHVDWLIVANYDQDHIDDLPNVQQALGVGALFRNPTITPTQLRALKIRQGGRVTDEMEHLLAMIGGYSEPVYGFQWDFAGLELRCFWNSFSEFDDTNNNSVVSFLHYPTGNFHAVIPGDLERAGWERLLLREDFRSELATVNVFVASHHGRENGYCPDVFRFARNVQLIIFSDSKIEHDTQRMCTIYHPWAGGVIFKGEQRFVLTTRNDGSFSWELNAPARFPSWSAVTDESLRGLLRR